MIPGQFRRFASRVPPRLGLRTPTALPHVDGFPVLGVLRRLRRPAPRGASGDPTFPWCWTYRPRRRCLVRPLEVIEMSQASWLVAGIVPGIERHPLKKLEPSEVDLLRLLMRWRAEATQKGRTITRIAVAFEAGRDGFWLARWLRARDIEAYVIHPTSVAVSREHRRAKTDRL